MPKMINYASEIRKTQAYDKNVAVMKLYASYWFYYKRFPFFILKSKQWNADLVLNEIWKNPCAVGSLSL